MKKEGKARKSTNICTQESIARAEAVKVKTLSMIANIQSILVDIYQTTKDWKKYPLDSSSPQDVRIKRIYGLVRSMDCEIEHAIINMYERSLQKFDLLLQYLCLGLHVDRENRETFDRELAPEIFVLKHKAMITYSMIPLDLNSCLPLSKLKRLQRPPLIRRAIQVARTLLYIGNTLKQEKFKLETVFRNQNLNIVMSGVRVKFQPFKKNGKSFRNSLWISRVFAANGMASKDSKTKAAAVSRSALREYCRMRLYHSEEYFSEHWDDFVQSVINNYKVPINFDKNSFLAQEPTRDGVNPEKTHVTSNILREFLMESNFIDIQPSLSRLESSFKNRLAGPLGHMSVYEKLQVLEIVRDNQRFDFSDLSRRIQSTIRLTDCFLAEAFLPLIALTNYLQCFEHLAVVDDKKLLEEEIALLDKNNQFAALEDEIRQLRVDQRLVEGLPDTVWLGLFEVDVREFKSGILSKLTKALEDVFVTTIYSKFLELLESNRVAFEHLVMNLITPIDSVDNFIKQKEFLSGTDFVEHLEHITKDLQLTKNLFEFQLEFLRWIDKPDAEKYLKSLRYLKELDYLRGDALERLGESGPRFIQELKKESETVFDELEKIQKEIKCFPYYCDIESADIYYEKTVEINKHLENMQGRAHDINRKQGVLESKTTNFDLIDNEIKGFLKYTQLWEFVAFKWSPVVERWWKGSFYDLNKFEMSNTLSYGTELLKKLYDEFSDSPKIQEIIKSKQTDIERHQNIYSHIIILKDPSFKERHWEAFFNEVKQEDKGSGLLHAKVDLKKLTLNDLMEMHLTSHTNFLRQILIKARAEAIIEQNIKETKENIRKIVIKPRIFDSDNNGIMVIPNINIVLTALEEHLSVCENMLGNPEYPEEFKRELRSLVRLVGFTTEIIRLIQRVQLKLIKFAPVFKFRDLTRYVSRADIVHVFARVRLEYMEVMRSIHLKEMGYFVLLVGDDNDDTKPNEVIKKLRDMNRQCEEILEALSGFFRLVRAECPRYYFFSNDQMLLLCSLLKFPKSLFGLIIALFKGIASVDLTGNGNDLADADQLSIIRLRTKCNESIKLPVPPNIDLSPTGQMPFISIVAAIERSIKRYMNNARSQHIFGIANCQFDFVAIFKYCRDNEIILQNCRLFVKLLFDFELLTLFKLNKHRIPERVAALKHKVIDSLQQLCEYPSKFLHGNYANKPLLHYWNSFVMLGRNLEETLELLQRHEVTKLDSFTFQSLPKYGMNLPTQSADAATVQAKLKEYLGSLAETLDDGQEPESTSPLSKESGVKLLETPLLLSVAPGVQLVKDTFANEKHHIVLSVLNYNLEYCDEVLADCQALVEFPIIEKRMFYLVTSVANNNFVMVKGGVGIGKNSSIRILSHMLAKNHYEYDCLTDQIPSLISGFIVGAVNGGFWLTFKGLEASPAPVMSLILTLLDAVKSAIPGASKRSIENLILKPAPGFAVFTTYRLAAGESISKFTELPINLLELFRVVRVSSPCFIGIINGLLGPVMSYTDGLEWANKLSFFLKVCSKIELVDPSQLSSDKPIKNAGESMSVGLSLPQLSLKVICSLIMQANHRFWAYAGRQYEKYRDSETGKFRIDINKIRVLSDKDRRAMFTKIFIEVITQHLAQAEIHRASVNALGDLLSKSFQTELEGSKLLHQSVVVPQADKKIKDKLLEYITDYREHNRDLRMLSPQKILAKAETAISTLLGPDEDRAMHFVVYGKPDFQKSMLIDLMAFAYSESIFANFKKYWLILENLSLESILGNQTSSGILGEIFNQSHILDLEDKSTQPKKINYLFQANSDLYFSLADARDQKRSRNTSNPSVSIKELSRAHNWVVIDANSSSMTTNTADAVEKIFGMFSALYSFKDINKHVGCSPRTKVFYELGTVATLNASILTDMKLIYLDKPLLDSKDRLAIWLDRLGLQDLWFQMVGSRLIDIIKGVTLPFIDLLESIHTKSPEVLLYNTSSSSMLSAVLNLLLIYLNEFRKYHVIHEFESLKNKPDVFATSKAEAQQSPHRSGGNNSAWKVLGSLNTQMKLAQQAQSVSRIQARSNGISPLLAGKTQSAHSQNHYLFGLESSEEIEDWETRRLEALVVFATVFALNSFFSEHRKPQIMKYFEEGAAKYAKKQKVHKSAFACGYLVLKEAKKGLQATDYCFDFTKGLWIRWPDVKFRALVEISPSFSNRNFSRTELERLNCQNAKLLNFNETVENVNSLETLVGLKDKSLFVGSEGNMLTYFCEYLISYGVHFTVMSDCQQGKTTLLTSIFRKLIEQNRIVTFNYQLDRNSKSEHVQARIESAYMKELGNVLRPGKGKQAVIWIDDIQLGSGTCKPQSLMRSLQCQNGWFSLSTNNFYKVMNTIFILALSIRENDQFVSRRTLSSINNDLLAKSPVLKMRKMTKEEFSTVFFQIVDSQIVSTPTSSKKAEEGLTAQISKRLVALLYDSRLEIAEATNHRGLRLSFENFFQSARTVNNVSWKDVNRDKRSVQWVWIWILRDLFTSELGLQYCEIKNLLKAREELTPSPILPAADFKMRKGNPAGKFNSGLFLTDRRASDREIQSPNSHDEMVIRRLRTGSAAVDLGGDKGIPGTPLTVGTQRKQRLKLMQDDIMHSEKESELDDDDYEFATKKGKMQISPLPQHSKFRSQALKKSSVHSSEKSIKIKKVSSGNRSDDDSHLETNSIEQIRAPFNKDFPIIIPPGQTDREDSVSQQQKSDLEPSIAENSEESQQPDEPLAGRGKSKFFEAAASSKPKIQLISAVNDSKADANPDATSARPSFMQTVSRGAPASSRHGSQLFPQSRKSMYGGGDSDEDLKPLTVRADSSSSDSDESSSGESPEYVFKDPNSQRISAFSFSKRDKKKKQAQTTVLDAPARQSTFLQIGATADLNASRRGSKQAPRLLKQKSRDTLGDSNSSESQVLMLRLNTKSPEVLLDEVLEKVLEKTGEKPSTLEKLKNSVFCNKLIFFDTVIQEACIGEELEKDYDLIPRSFEVLMTKSADPLLGFLKSAIQNFVMHSPEAALSFNLELVESRQFMSDFTGLHLALHTEFQHLLVTCLKSQLYVQHLIGLVCECSGDAYFFYDMTHDNSLQQQGDHAYDIFRSIKNTLKENFDRVLKNNKKLVFVVSIPDLNTAARKQVVSQIFELVSAIVFNTDTLLTLLDEQFYEHVAQVKKHRLSSHYEDFFAAYLVRNKLESHITFVLLHEQRVEGMSSKRMQFGHVLDQSQLPDYLQTHHPKLFTRFKKVLFNGLRAVAVLEDKQGGLGTPSDPLLMPWTSKTAPNIFHKSVILELGFLKHKKDWDGLRLLTGRQESLHMFAYLKHHLLKKVQGKQGDSEHVERDQRLLLDRIGRRKEILRIDIDKLEAEQQRMKEELTLLSSARVSVDRSIDQLRSDREKLKTLLVNHKEKVELCKRELEKIVQFDKDLKDAQETILGFQEAELQKQLAFGGFFMSPVFTIYAVLFNELFRMPVEPKLSYSDLIGLSNTGDAKRFTNHAKYLAKLLEDPAKSLLPLVRNPVLDGEKISAERLLAMYKIVKKMEDEGVIKRFNEAQKLFLIWMDFMIQLKVQENKKPELEQMGLKSQTAFVETVAQIDQHSKLLVDLEISVSEQTRKRQAHEASLETVVEKIKHKRDSLAVLTKFLESLTLAQSLYVKMISPFLSYGLDRSRTIELVTSFIVFWSKYSSLTKKVLFYSLLQATDTNPEVFNEVAIYEFLNPELPLVAALQSKIPFTQNMLNNVSIMNLAHEAMLPYCIVQDSSSIILKWFEHKFTRFAYVEHSSPTAKTLEQLEVALVNGQPYFLVDPNDELLRLVAPIVEWRYKRYSESVLIFRDFPISPSVELKFHQKKLIPKDGFRLVILLHTKSIEQLDTSLIAKCFLLNNTHDDRKLCTDLLTEELILNIESERRDMCIKSFVDTDLRSQIYEKYNEMTAKISIFDFITDDVSSYEFKKIEILLSDVINSSNQQLSALGKKKQLLEQAAKALTTRNSVYLGDLDRDSKAENFLSSALTLGIKDYKNLEDRYFVLAERIKIYQVANQKVLAFLGHGMQLGPEMFSYLLSECISWYRPELDQLVSRPDVPKEAFESVFSKIEQALFSQVLANIPEPSRFIYGFICGIVNLIQQSQAPKPLMKSLHLFLYSEKLLPKEHAQISFVSSKLYQRFNNLYRGIQGHFIYSSTNLPGLWSVDQNFDSLLSQLKSLEQLDLTDLEQIRKTDNARLQAISALLAEGREQRNKQPEQPADTSLRIMAESLKGEGENTLDMENSFKLDHSGHEGKRMPTMSQLGMGADRPSRMMAVLDQSRGAPLHERILPGDSSPQINRRFGSRTGLAQMSEKIDPSLGTFGNRVSLSRLSSVEVHVDSYAQNEPNVPLTGGGKRSLQKQKGPDTYTFALKLKALGMMPTEGMGIVQEETPGLTGDGQEQDTQTKSGTLPKFAPQKSMNTVLALRTATKGIISKLKEAKQNRTRSFLKQLQKYLETFLPMLIKLDKSVVQKISEQAWLEFMTFTRSALVASPTNHVYPAMPLPAASQEELGRLDSLTFLKYSRPDMIGYLCSNFYSSIRGPAFLETPIDLGVVSRLENLKRPVLVMYGNTTLSPVTNLSRVAAANKVGFSLMRIKPEVLIDDITKLLEELSSKAVWVAFENIQLLSPTLSNALLESLMVLLRKLKRDPKFKVFLFMQANAYLSDYLSGKLSMPSWFGACVKLFIGRNKSIRQELVGLYWQDIYELSTSTRGQLVQVPNKQSALALTRARSSIWVGDSQELGMSRQQSSQKFTTQPSVDSSLEEQRDRANEPERNLPGLNLIKEFLTVGAGENNSKEFTEKFKPRSVFCLKFLCSIMRQRAILVDNMIGSREYSIRIYKNDNEIDLFFEGRLESHRNVQRSDRVLKGALAVYLRILQRHHAE